MFNSASGILTNCTFSGNATIGYGNGGAIVLFPGAHLTVVGCTFSGNSAVGIAGGIYCTGYYPFYPSSVSLKNTIIAFSTAGEAVNCGQECSVTLTYCDVYGNAGGDWVGCIADQNGVSGNICEDPIFVDANGGDYHLVCFSPCIDAGDPNYVPGPNETDIDGELRLTGEAIDMGSDEAPDYMLTITATDGGITEPNVGTHIYRCGSVVEVNAIPWANYMLDHWELDENDVGPNNPYSIFIDGNHTLHAVFSQIECDLTITAAPGGTTEPPPGAYTYECGCSVEVNALPEIFHLLDYWELDGNDVGPNEPYSVVMDSNHALHAVFAPVGNIWLMFGHDLGHTRYSLSEAPDTDTVSWSYTTSDHVWCSPAVADGKVYVGSHDCNVYCLNAATGDLIWTYTTGDLVLSSPAVADGNVYVGSHDYNVYCLPANDPNGDGVIDSCEVIWICTTGGEVVSSPALADGKVYVASYDDNVYCLPQNDPNGDGVIDSNEVIWTYATDSWVGSSPAVADGKVYVGSGVFDTNVYCLPANDPNGDGVIEDSEVIWSYTTGGRVYSSPAVADGKVYVGSDDNKVYCLPADDPNGDGVIDDNEVIWSYTTLDDVFSSPAVAYGKVYVGSDDNKVYCLPADDPNGDGVIDSNEVIWTYATGAWVSSSPAVADGKVYVGSYDTNVYCLDAETGAEIWNYATGDEIQSSPAVAYGRVYVGSWDGKVYAFGPIVVDDFDSYASTEELRLVWDDGLVNGTDSEIFLETDANFTRDGNSMRYEYTNSTFTGGKCIGAMADANPVDLERGPDWTIADVKALVLYFLGDPCTVTPDLGAVWPWLELEDTNSNTGWVMYPDPNHVTEPTWHEWNIDLAIFDACGVALSSIERLSIGIGGYRVGQKSKATTTNQLWFDDIRLYPPRCRPELVVTDLTGDCITDFPDLDKMAGEWLSSGIEADIVDDDNVNFLDYGLLGDNWLAEFLWPEP